MTDSYDAESAKLEADLASTRIAEFKSAPVQGKFDADHLREIHRRIFQDFPEKGFDEVTPGQFRQPVTGTATWMKKRALESGAPPHPVAYSRMDEAAQARLSKALADVSVESLAKMEQKEVVATLSKLYSELDYLHPFDDGNSRTLRVFTGQIAQRAGYVIDWDRFATTPEGRDTLYVARDLAVNDLALPGIENPGAMMRVARGMSQLRGKPELKDLLADSIRPARSVAFERAPQNEAIAEFPELAPAYKLLQTASKYVLSKGWDEEKTSAALADAKGALVKRMDGGETIRFEQVNAEQDKSPVRSLLRQGLDAKKIPEPGKR